MSRILPALFLTLLLACSSARHPDSPFFFKRQGKTVPALPFDNGPDYFVEGLARTLINGKVGFVNENLDEVIPPVWDFAFPFQNGVAVVCTGCISSGGEHTVRKGGKWGYIDRTGKIIVPVIYDEATLPARPR
jgi:hypothetical protein